MCAHCWPSVDSSRQNESPDGVFCLTLSPARVSHLSAALKVIRRRSNWLHASATCRQRRMTSGMDESWLEAMRRQLNTGKTISGATMKPWPEAPSIRELSVPLAMIPLQRPQGPLQALVGPRITASELKNADHGDVDATTLESVNAWSVLPLIGAEIVVEDSQGVAAALRGLLSTTIPGLDWWVPEDW